MNIAHTFESRQEDLAEGPRALALRPYQEEALIVIEQAKDRGVTRLLIALPTGTGKTVIFANLIQQRAG
jgi:superfamily II DNA or RNA helicase